MKNDPQQKERLEAALRTLAKNPQVTYAWAAARNDVTVDAILAWLREHNGGSRKLDELTLDSVLKGVPLPKAAAGPANDIGLWLQEQRAEIVGRVTVFQVKVTPALAHAWLALNVKNRIPSNPKIRRFAKMMSDGKWTLNGETIKWSKNGRLLDGQSRLMAIVKSGVPVILELRAGLAEATQESMDTGEARQHRHQLEMLGEKNPNEVAAALRLVYFWEKGLVGSAGSSGNGTRDITNTTIREMLEKHPGIRESVGRCLNLKQLVPISAGAFFHYVFARADRKKADAFIERLTTGANLAATSPIYLLREALTQDRLAPAKMVKRAKFALIVKAWNAYIAGKPLQKLSFSSAEVFPEISGLKREQAVAA